MSGKIIINFSNERYIVQQNCKMKVYSGQWSVNFSAGLGKPWAWRFRPARTSCPRRREPGENPPRPGTIPAAGSGARTRQSALCPTDALVSNRLLGSLDKVPGSAGIETEAQLTYLPDIGCIEGSGPSIGAAKDAADTEALVAGGLLVAV